MEKIEKLIYSVWNVNLHFQKKENFAVGKRMNYSCSTITAEDEDL